MSFGFFCWYDLYTDRLDDAKSFYGELFGWTYRTDTSGETPYHIINDTHCDTGGMCTVPEAPPVWQTYVTVEDIDGTIETAKAHGGALIHGPFDAKGVGRMALMTDPEGAHIWGIQLNTPMPEPPGIPKHGQFCWRTLMTRDLKPALAFYNAVFGWTAQTMDAGGGVSTTGFMNEGMPVGGVNVADPNDPTPSHWAVAIATDDINATLAKASELGATTVVPVMPIGEMGLFCVVQDPVGAHVSFWQQLAPPSA